MLATRIDLIWFDCYDSYTWFLSYMTRSFDAGYAGGSLGIHHSRGCQPPKIALQRTMPRGCRAPSIPVPCCTVMTCITNIDKTNTNTPYDSMSITIMTENRCWDTTAPPQPSD